MSFPHQDIAPVSVSNIRCFPFQLSSDIWLVAEEFTANNVQELSVTKGQQVEIVDTSPNGNSEWCLVRTLATESGVTPQEGLVPMATLKQMPNLKVSGSHTSIENEGRSFLCHPKVKAM